MNSIKVLTVIDTDSSIILPFSFDASGNLVILSSGIHNNILIKEFDTSSDSVTSYLLEEYNSLYAKKLGS